MNLNDFLNLTELQLRKVSKFIGIDYTFFNGNTVIAKAATIFNYCKNNKLLSNVENYLKTCDKSKTDFKEPNFKKRFKIAFSFPGECRNDIIKPIADKLSIYFNSTDEILYDEFHKSEFARPNLDTYLQKLYHNQSDLIVVCLCSQYNEKEWCGIEWRAIRNLLNNRNDNQIMFLRVDKGTVDGIFGTIDGFIDASKHNIDEVVGFIIERYDQLQTDSQ